MINSEDLKRESAKYIKYEKDRQTKIATLTIARPEKLNALTIGMKMSFERQDELLKDDRFYPTPYAARQGWVSLHVNKATDWGEVAELVREAYRQVALQRMLKALDA